MGNERFSYQPTPLALLLLDGLPTVKDKLLMKMFKTYALIIALSFWGLSSYAAETPGTDAAAATRPEKPDKEKPDKPEHPEHPANPGRPALPDDVKKLIEESKEARAAFLAEQKELITKLKGATQEERQKIRDDLSKNREEFLAQQKELREQVRDRLKEIRAEFKDNRDKIIDEARKNRGNR